MGKGLIVRGWGRWWRRGGTNSEGVGKGGGGEGEGLKVRVGKGDCGEYERDLQWGWGREGGEWRWWGRYVVGKGGVGEGRD